MHRRYALSLAITVLLIAGVSTRIESNSTGTAPDAPVLASTPQEDVTAAAPAASSPNPITRTVFPPVVGP